MLVINAISPTTLSSLVLKLVLRHIGTEFLHHTLKDNVHFVCLLTYIVGAAGTLYRWLALQQYVRLQCCATPFHFQIQLTSVSICDSRHKIVPCLSLYHIEVSRLTVVDLFQSPTNLCFCSSLHSITMGPLKWKSSCFYCMLFRSLTHVNFI